MKKLLLSAAFLGFMFQVSAQEKVGIGAYDSFNSEDPYSATKGGIYWWGDKDTTYKLTRNGESLVIAVNKNGGYDAVGFGFGDTKSDGTGIPYVLDLSGKKELILTASTDGASAPIDIQLFDADGTKIELLATNAGWGGANKITVSPNGTPTATTFDLSGARVVRNWDCTKDASDNTIPTTCPTIDDTANFDFTKVAKVQFLISGGTPYKGNFTFEDLKLGSAPAEAGLNTSGVLATTAASNLASSVTVSPNPASEFATVSYNSNSSNVVVKVTDLTGSVVKTVNGTSSYATVSTSDLTTGLYMVTVVVDGSAVKTERLFVK